MHTHTPAVSILVPVYKVAPFIETCVRSLFEQTFQDIEYVFVDDCSPDDSMEILNRVLSEYPERQHQVKILRNEENQGIAQVRNRLMETASGEYLYFVDSDDWIERNAVEVLWHTATQYRADMVGANHYHDYGKKAEKIRNLYGSGHIDWMKNLVSMRIKPVLWLFLIRRTLFTENQLSFVRHIDVGEDYLMCAKLLYHARMVVAVDKAFYHYTSYNANSYSTNHIKYHTETIEAIEAVQDFCKEKGIYEQLKPFLDYRKFILKSKYLLDNHHYDFHSYLRVFPEMNGYWKGMNYRRDIQLYFFLVEHHCFKGAWCLFHVRRLFATFAESILARQATRR